MQCHKMRFLSQLPAPVAECHFFRILGCTAHRWRYFFGGRSCCCRWDRDTDVGSRRGPRFGDDYEMDEYDAEDNFRFRGGSKQRIWWSDDSYEGNDDGDEGFGILEESIGLDWIFKVFRAFGWMIPAVIISLLFGTDPNSIIMTLALPLSQTALSLVADALWGRSNEAPRPKTESRKRKRPFTRSTTNGWVRKGKEAYSRSGRREGDVMSWMGDDKASDKYEKTNRQNFGGWDELDDPR